LTVDEDGGVGRVVAQKEVVVLDPGRPAKQAEIRLALLFMVMVIGWWDGGMRQDSRRTKRGRRRLRLMVRGQRLVVRGGTNKTL
jgi:hypothetical protein